MYIWFNVNKLSVNVKTHAILFRVQNNLLNLRLNFKIFFDGKQIDRMYTTKFHGVLIGENISWKSHISYISFKKISELGCSK